MTIHADWALVLAIGIIGLPILALIFAASRDRAARPAAKKPRLPSSAEEPRAASTPVEIALKADDFKTVGELIGDWARINEPLEVAGGSFSPLFLAAREGAVGTITYLLSMGANPDDEFDGVTPRSLALRPSLRQCLSGFFRGGVTPNGCELLAFACSGIASVVPETGTDGSLRHFLAELQVDDLIASSFDENSIGKIIKGSTAFRTLTAPAIKLISTGKANVANRAIRNPGLKFRAKQEIQDLEEQISTHAGIAALVLSISTNLMFAFPDKMHKAVVRNFSPFRYNLGILDRQANAATTELAEWFGPHCGLPEDHNSIVQACRTAVLRYPIRAVLEGLPRQTNLRPRAAGLNFEAETAEILGAAGYQVQLTARTGDQGADLLVGKDAS